MIRACVIGWPIGHSRSPLIHGYWLQQLGIAGSYDKVEVAPAQLAEFVAGLGADLAGCNVTVPHKEAALALVDEADATARAVGAVNTMWIRDEKKIGSNSDVEGFLENLEDQVPGWDAAPLHAVVLGAGGAARAVVYGLAQRGAKRISVVNRSEDRAVELAAAIGGAAHAAKPADFPRLLVEATLVVNASSLGMTGKPPLDLSLHGLSTSAVVADLVYAPLATPLLKAARERGNRTADGLGMLLHQAVFGFEKWFGARPKVTPNLRRLVEADLAASAR